MPYANPEKIMCAANWYPDDVTPANCNPVNIEKGLVVCGISHCQAGYIYNALTGKNFSTISGFMTSHNRFVDREEGMSIARHANQIVRDIPKDSASLFSEDLFSEK